MAKKATAKKSAKKAAKKAMKKSAKKAARPAKKAAKKATKKAAKKSAPKKAAKKSAPKKAAKKSAKKAVKKTVKKAAKKAVKKVAKKATAKKSTAKKAVKKAVKKVARPIKKAVAKKAAPAKKVVAKVRKAVRKPAPKTMIQKVESTLGTMTHNITDFVKDTVSNVIERITPDRTSDDAPAYERPSNDDTDSESSSESRGHDNGDSEDEEGSSDDEEEDRASSFVKHQTRLSAGDKAPWFESRDQYGRLVTPDSFPGQALVLYFYPKDDTEGCTAESCSLRDGRFHLRDRNYAIIGVSADDAHSHAMFADKYNLPFPLLADTDMQMIRDYDVWGKKMLAGKIYDGIVRTTFIIDPDGTIRHVITDVDTQNHAQQILELEEA